MAAPCHTGSLRGVTVFTHGEWHCDLYSVHMYTQGRRAHVALFAWTTVTR